MLAFLVSTRLSWVGLVLCGSGNFIDIAASDLIPEIKSQKRLATGVLHFGLVTLGLAITHALACGLH